MYDKFLPFDVRNAIVDHMVRDEGREACGYIFFEDGAYKYEPCENIHENPKEHFRFSPEVAAKISASDNVIAFCHSHPEGPCFPSMHDMEIQISIGKPSVICARNKANGVVDIFSFGDHLLDYPLIGREFRYAVLDCYEAIRSWKWQVEKEKTTPFARPDGWWGGMVNGTYVAPFGNYYEDNFRQLGYDTFTPNLRDPKSPLHPQLGDVLLMQLGATVCNHAAVYTGNNKIYHHRMFHRSMETPVGHYLDNHYCRMWLRRKDKL